MRSIVALGQTLRLSTVAEGVEGVEQAAELRELDCDYAQGYLFSRPVESAQVTALLGGRAPADDGLAGTLGR